MGTVFCFATHDCIFVYHMQVYHHIFVYHMQVSTAPPGLSKLMSLKGAMGGLMGQVGRMFGGGEGEDPTEQVGGKGIV